MGRDLGQGDGPLKVHWRIVDQTWVILLLIEQEKASIQVGARKTGLLRVN